MFKIVADIGCEPLFKDRESCEPSEQVNSSASSAIYIPTAHGGLGRSCFSSQCPSEVQRWESRSQLSGCYVPGTFRSFHES